LFNLDISVNIVLSVKRIECLSKPIVEISNERVRLQIVVLLYQEGEEVFNEHLVPVGVFVPICSGLLPYLVDGRVLLWGSVGEVTRNASWVY
jgi:hypothetical protein